MAIRTPDQRIRVFLSSTLEELAEERGAVREAIDSLRMTPVMFEQGARPHPPRVLYRAYLEQSDVFIGLYWERYGWIAPGEAISGLEDEYGLAGDRPKLIYIKTPAPNREPRLSELIARIQHDDHVSYRRFGEANELRSIVADDLAVLLTERFSSTAPQAGPSQMASLAPLPRPPTRLIGREEDVARVMQLLSDPGTRLVTIVGTGGIGKSRLALAVAEQTKDRYVDGAAYVELATVSEPPLLLPTIATALGLQEGPGVSVATQLRERLSDAHMLIVLDNVEQLADAAADLSDLLAGTGALQLLVTSRRILEIRDEHVYELEPLGIPAADGAITPAVELFLERAHDVRPDFQPNSEELGAIAEICRRLDGLPLAIELASARLRLLPPRVLLERMGHHRLEFLRTGARDLPPRQRTLRDTIAWSHSLLSTDSQLLFARLAVFVGSTDLEAIEQVTNSDARLDTLTVLAELVDGSLVHAAGEAAEPRFAMLETIREFAVERLEASGHAADFRARHEAHYLDLAERGNAALRSPEQVAWLDRLGRENDNFRAILRRALRRGDAAGALRMGRALSSYWHMRSGHTEGRDWMEQIAALPSAGPRERAAAWTIGAIQAFLNGNFEPIETGLDDAAPLANEGENRRVVAFAQLLRTIARGASEADGHWQEAVAEAARRLDAEGEALAVGFGLVASAMLARVHGRMDESQRLAQAALDLSMRTGEWYVRAYASTQLARAALAVGDWGVAQRHAVESLRAAQRLRNRYSMSYAMELWATVELHEGRIEPAGRLFALAERGYREVGSGPWRTDVDLHKQLKSDLHAALGGRYEQLVAEAQEADLDEAITKLLSASAMGREKPQDE